MTIFCQGVLMADFLQPCPPFSIHWQQKAVTQYCCSHLVFACSTEGIGMAFVCCVFIKNYKLSSQAGHGLMGLLSPFMLDACLTFSAVSASCLFRQLLIYMRTL